VEPKNKFGLKNFIFGSDNSIRKVSGVPYMISSGSPDKVNVVGNRGPVLKYSRIDMKTELRVFSLILDVVIDSVSLPAINDTLIVSCLKLIGKILNELR